MGALGNAIRFLTILGVMALLIKNPQYINRFVALVNDLTKRVFALGDTGR